MTYKKDFFKTKGEEIDDLFLEYIVAVMEDLQHPAFIEEWIRNIDAAAYEKIYTKMKIYHQLRSKLIVTIKQNDGQKASWKVSIGYLFLISWSSLQTGQRMI